MSKTTTLPDGFGLKSAQWHLKKFIEFTALKKDLGEPSPHLTIVGYMAKDSSMEKRLWLLGCYAATYCLPTAQVIWSLQPVKKVRKDPSKFSRWLEENWKGIVTRTERRCVRTPAKMSTCLLSYVDWMDNDYPQLKKLEEQTEETYDRVWDSVSKIKFFGRYINIRLVEGLRRYCGIPASLYDIRSIGGWSPKKCLCYLYPKQAERLLVDDKPGNELTNKLAYDLLSKVAQKVPGTDCYRLAAMLCEYKGAYEKRHQYPGWTIDQEPLLYDKVLAYWTGVIDTKLLWQARKALFPREVLGEFSGWHGTRWPAAKTLRDYGYNWDDMKYNYKETEQQGRFERPTRR